MITILPFTIGIALDMIFQQTFEIYRIDFMQTIA